MDETQQATLWSQLDRPTLLIGNPESLLEKFPGMADQFADCQALTMCGNLESDDPAAELTQRIKSSHAERLWIIGGDGTINLVAEWALRFQSAIPCWLTPAGTANDLVRSILEHVERDPLAGRLQDVSSETVLSKALSALSPVPTTRIPVSIDLMRIELDNGQHLKSCANMLTLGTSARNTQHVTSEIKARWGALAYLTQAWRAMNDLEPFNLRLTVGESQSITASNILNVFIANGAYCGGGHRIAPTAELDDGKFNVILLRSGTTTELAHLTAAFLAGTHLDHELIEHFTTSRLMIEFESASPITLDGEPFTAQKIDLQSAPRALTLQLAGA